MHTNQPCGMLNCNGSDRYAATACQVSGERGITRLVEEACPRDIFAARRDVRLLVALAAGFEGQLELNARGIIDEQLPQRGPRHDELAKVEIRRLEPRDIGA